MYSYEDRIRAVKLYVAPVCQAFNSMMDRKVEIA